MMRVDSMKILSEGVAVVDFFADFKADVTEERIKELVPNFELANGSSVFTAASELGFLRSDGTWEWGE